MAAVPNAIAAAVHQLEIHSRRQLRGLAGGYRRSLFRGQGLTFAELSAYQDGDDLRHLDAAASARSGRLQMRRYHEERNQTLLLLADLSPSVTPPKRRLRDEVAALLCFAAALQRDRVGLIGFSDRLECVERPRPGLQQARHLLHRLLESAPRGQGTELATPLTVAGSLLKQPALVVILSDCHAPLPADLMRRLAVRHDLLGFVLRDPEEKTPPANALLQLRDAETGALLTLDPRRRSELNLSWQERDRALAAELGGCGVEPLFLSTRQPAVPAILDFFRRRRRNG